MIILYKPWQVLSKYLVANKVYIILKGIYQKYISSYMNQF